MKRETDPDRQRVERKRVKQRERERQRDSERERESDRERGTKRNFLRERFFNASFSICTM